MGIGYLRKAVFLDRDGVINPLVPTPNDERNSPRNAAEFCVYETAVHAIWELNRSGWLTIVISNQPNIAKGKSSFQDLKAITAKMASQLSERDAWLDDVFYCLHHPDPEQVKTPELLKNCFCRKPKPGLIFEAARKWDIDLEKSWMVGDSVSDIEAGRSANCHTILVKEGLKYEDIHRLC